MSKKLNTKYTNFINESLIVRYFESILHNMAKTDLVASLLCSLMDTQEHYKDNSQINYISFTDKINMMSFVPLNNRKDGFESKVKTEIRIGRMVKRIISDVDRSRLKLDYKGKVLVEKNNNFDAGVRTNLIFCVKYTGEEMKDKMQTSDFLVTYEYPNGNDFNDKCSTRVNLKIENKHIVTSVANFNDTSYMLNYYKGDQFSNLIYLRFELVDSVDDIGEEVITRGSLISEEVAQRQLYDCELNLENLFGGKTIDQINDQDIERFTNELISRIKMIRAGDDSKVEVVKGEDIKKWYNRNNYQSLSGQLGSSCMGDPDCGKFLGIYVYNPEVVSLLILKNSNDKLIGRALLWELQDGKYFMDRVYCTTDYDTKLFIKYANDNGYYYRNNSNNNLISYYLNDKEIDEVFLSVSVANSDFEYYPYMDTLFNLDTKESVLFNRQNNEYHCYLELRDTEGRWVGFEDDEEFDEV